MSANDTFGRALSRFLEAEGSMTAPAGLHDDVVERARRSRQRPGWLVRVRGGTLETSVVEIGRPWVRVRSLLVVLALALVALIAAIAAGAFRPDPIKPLLGRNGAIVYDLQDLSAGIHVIGSDGSGHREIAGGICPTYSHDGSVLAYWTGDSPELVVAAADGSAPRRQSIFADGAHPEDRFALSPDGTQFAWIKRIRAHERTWPDGSTSSDGWDDELWVIPVSNGTGVRIVPISGATNETRALPVWSSDGRRIAYATFVSGATESHRSSIDVIAIDGSNPMRLTSRLAWGSAGMSWSPDGRLIAYAGIPDGVLAPSGSAGDQYPGDGPPLDIFVIVADGTGDRNLTNSGVNEAGPRWSPDGSHLAYLTATETMDDRLDTVRMDGSAPIGPPATGPIVSGFFSWSPDGSRLLYLQQTPTGSTDRLRRTRSAIRAVEPEFRGPSATLVDVEYVVLCPPSWQRLEP